MEATHAYFPWITTMIWSGITVIVRSILSLQLDFDGKVETIMLSL